MHHDVHVCLPQVPIELQGGNSKKNKPNSKLNLPKKGIEFRIRERGGAVAVAVPVAVPVAKVPPTPTRIAMSSTKRRD
jgi:hypothetical protein